MLEYLQYKVLVLLKYLHVLILQTQFLWKEINRKFNITGSVRKLSENDTDIESNLKGKVAIITGGTRGIGVEAVKTFLRKGCHVITCSSGSSAGFEKRKTEIFAEICSDGTEAKGKLEIWHLNLKSLKSVKEFTQKFIDTKLPLHYLICNAGIFGAKYELTEDGFESHLGINYLSQCVLTWDLLPIIIKTGKSNCNTRIVYVSAALHLIESIQWNDLQYKNHYNPLFAYGQSKLAQIMFGYKLQRWLNEKNANCDVFSLHPGICKTELVTKADNQMKVSKKLLHLLPFRSSKEGAETIIYAALSSQLKGKGCKYLDDSAISTSNSYSRNEKLQEKLWTVTWSLVKKFVKSDVN